MEMFELFDPLRPTLPSKSPLKTLADSLKGLQSPIGQPKKPQKPKKSTPPPLKMRDLSLGPYTL